MRSLRWFIAIVLVVSLAAVTAWAEGSENQQIPELAAFHEVMAKMWHEYYPAQNWTEVRKAAPELQARVNALLTAKLPEMFANRQEAFDVARRKLEQAVVDLAEASKPGNPDAPIAEAVKNVHDAFHGMVVTIYSRPAVLQEFHAALYPIWHVDKVKNDFAALKDHAPRLAEIMPKVEAADLKPYPIEPPDYAKGAATLRTHVDALVKSTKAGDTAAAWAALEQVHEAYMALDKLFD